MAIIVPKGSFYILNKKTSILKSEFLGAGIAVGVLDLEKDIAGLASYVFPYKEDDMEIENEPILSGQSLIPLFLEGLEKERISLETAKFAIVGASKYKENPEFLDLGEKNEKVARAFIKKLDIPERNVIIKTGLSVTPMLEINLKDKKMLLKTPGKEVVLW